jgi:t-SNARE complex subunit (syntaxin)
MSSSTAIDRLVDLRRRHLFFFPKSKLLPSLTASPPSTPTTSAESSQSEFLSHAASVQSDLAQLSASLEQLARLRVESYAVTTQSAETALDAALASATIAINNQLKSIKAAIDDLASDSPSEAANARLRGNVLSVLSRRFRDRLIEYQKLQVEISESKRARVTRVVDIATGGKLSPKDISNLIDGHADIKELLKQQALVGGGGALDEDYELLGQVELARSRVRDLKTLEKAVNQLSQLFVEMSSLVATQGEMIDSIEWSVINTKNFAVDAKKALHVARLKQHKNMKLAMYLLIGCLLLLAAILIPILIKEGIFGG